MIEKKQQQEEKRINNVKTNTSNNNDDEQQQQRSFRVGEVIVPMVQTTIPIPDKDDFCLNAGTDYRIMTITTKDGIPIFSTNDVPPTERNHVRLALRQTGTGSKIQQKQQMMKKKKPKPMIDWPVEVEAGLLSSSCGDSPLTRFNLATILPRVKSTFQRETTSVLLGIALALLPLPAALIGRNFISLYAIPSASMDPTLIKGDVLLVEKFPNIYDRTRRGDIVLFKPPIALQDIINGGSSNNNRGSSSVAKSKIDNSLFVKRIVGIPGDRDIVLELETKEITLNGGKSPVGPNRNLCDDEPLKLIDRFLENGKGKFIEELNENDIYVLGDCKDVSIDSRVFGILPKQNIEGKPIGRIWPPSRITFKPL